MIRAWRLSPGIYMDRFLSGAGAYRHGGRWNSPGRAVVYLSECLSLCVLESLVHRVTVPMMEGFKCIWVDIPKASITALAEGRLPGNWQDVPAPSGTKEIGDGWFDTRAFLALKVPSTIISTEFNFLLNPSHPDFHKLKIGEVQDFVFDKRLSDASGF